jgi:hypothetical protein
MNYLTNYYKNLSEQLQEKVNFLQKILNEAERVTDPNYDFKAHSLPQAWETNDYHPDTVANVAYDLSSHATRDVTDKWDDGKTFSDKVPSRYEFNPRTGEEAFYNVKSDAPSDQFTPRWMQLIKNKERNQEIRNQQIRNVIKKEAATEEGNFDAMAIPAQALWQNKNTRQNLQQLKQETEANRRKSLGQPVKED